jgi:hypothetical protein
MMRGLPVARVRGVRWWSAIAGRPRNLMRLVARRKIADLPAPAGGDLPVPAGKPDPAARLAGELGTTAGGGRVDVLRVVRGGAGPAATMLPGPGESGAGR